MEIIMESNEIQHGIVSCPYCHFDFDGGMIPVERRHLYDGAERYSLLIEKLGGLICPSCRTSIPPLP